MPAWEMAVVAIALLVIFLASAMSFRLLMWPPASLARRLVGMLAVMAALIVMVAVGAGIFTAQYAHVLGYEAIIRITIAVPTGIGVLAMAAMYLIGRRWEKRQRVSRLREK